VSNEDAKLAATVFSRAAVEHDIEPAGYAVDDKNRAA
jgi:hypothetical protein